MKDLEKLSKAELIAEIKKLRNAQQSKIESDNIDSEIKFRENEEFLRSVVDNSINAIVVADDLGNYLSVNKSATEMFGYSREQMLEMNVGQIVTTSDPNSAEKYKLYLEKGREIGEFDFIHSNGEARIAQYNAVRIKENLNLSILTDFTNLKKAEEKFRISENHLRIITNNLPILISQIDQNLNYIFANQYYYDISGRTSSIIGENIREVIGEEHFNHAYPQIQQALSGKFVSFESRYIDKNNKLLILETNYIPHIVDNKVHSFFVLGIDITDRKNVELELKASEEKFSNAFNKSPIALSITDFDTGNRIDINDKFIEVFGYSRDELLRADIHETNLSVDDNELKTAVSKIIGDGGLQNYPYQMRAKSGEIRKLLVSAARISGPNKNQFIISNIDITDQKLAEEKLKESEVKFRSLYDNAPLSYQSLNEDGSFKDINPTWLTTLGYERDEVIGKFYKDFLHPDWQPHFEENFPAFKKRGYVSDVQFKIRHKAGHYIDIAFEGCIGYLPDGSFKQTYCVFTDITERKKIELEFIKQKNMFELVINSVPEKIFWKDINSKYLGCNSAFIESVGKNSIEDVIGKTDFDLIWANEAQKFINDDKEIINSGIAKLNYEESYIIKNGENIWWKTSKMPLKDISGKTIGILSTSEDITEQKKAEDSLKQSEERFDLAVKGSNDAIWDWDDMESDEYWWSDRLYEILGYEPGEVEARISNWVKWMHPDDSDNVTKVLNKHLKGNEPYQVEFRMQKKDGSYAWVAVSGESMRDNTGKPTRMAGSLSDITERKNVELEIKESEARFRTIINQAGDALYLCNMKGEIKMVNNYSTEMLGYSSNEFLSMNIVDLDVEYINLDQQKELWNKLEFNKAQTILSTHKHKNGSSISVEIRLSRIHYDGYAALLGFVRNITERKQVEAKIRAAEKSLQNTFDISPSIICKANVASGYFTEVNKAVTRILGYSLEEFKSKKIIDFIHPDDIEITDKEIEKQLKGKSVESFENRYLCKDGSYKWMAWNTTKADENNIVTAVVTDITERKKTDLELAKYQEHLEELVKERTKDLEDKNGELERFNDLFVDREFRIKELKDQLKEFKE